MAGLGTVSVVLAAVFVAWLTDSRTMPLPPPGPLGLTLQVCVAAVASVLPAASVAQTPNAWDPVDKPVWVWGEVHATRGAPSRLHWNVELGSLEVNAKDALFDVDVAGGPDVIVVSGGVVSPAGGVVSTVHVWLAGVGSAPFWSEARTWKLCVPTESPVYDTGLVQLANAAESSEQANVALVDVEVKLHWADVELVGVAGLLVIVVSGGWGVGVPAPI